MFRLREFRDSDLPTLQEIHNKRGSKFELPTDAKEALVAADEVTDKAVLIIAAREIRELVLWIDPEWATPAHRWAALKIAHEAMRECLANKGVEFVVSYLEPSIAKAFGKRLKSLGWGKTLWECYHSLTKRN